MWKALLNLNKNSLDKIMEIEASLLWVKEWIDNEEVEETGVNYFWRIRF